MVKGKLLLGAAALATALVTGGVGSAPAEAADISCRTAKLIVPWGAGGGTDVIFRVFVEAVNNQGAEPQLQVVNISGQGGNKGAKEAVRAKPDGCTLFAIHQSAITSFLNGRVDFTWNAFEPVAMLTRTPAIFGANPDVPYNNIKELVAAAKEKPGEIVAGGTLGSTSHFVFLLLEDAAGVKFKHVSYDGTRQRMTALLAKNIELGEINLASAKQYIATGELKALGITTPERNGDIPEVMTLQEQGYNMIYGTDRGIMLPKDTPQEIVDHYASLFETAAKDPAVVAEMNAKGTEVVYLDPQGYTAYFEDTFTNWKRIAQEVGIYKGQ
ncbi:MAG TPA: tripartite tricarboxylate transporter substrate binding protein [Kiloniellaceae bacterium]|nr:tripartite tricarboxylate transporter substrate binding protein [Kiloniellaceae bacterium]